MPTYRTLDLHGGTFPGDPPAGNVVARKVAVRLGPHQQMIAQDRILGSGRRVLLTLPMGPVDDTWIADTNPSIVGADPTYPPEDTAYVVARASSICVTPGSVLRCELLALPSGPTQYTPGSGWEPAGGQGIVRVTVVLTNEDGDTVTLIREISVSPSKLLYGRKPPELAGCWKVVEEHWQIEIPDGFDNVAATAAKWSTPHMTAAITVAHVGSPRVIDLCIYEDPRRAVRDISKASWPAHLYTSGGGQAYAQYPHTYPVEQTSATDPAIGMEHLLETARQTALQLGPMLFCWSSWDQDSATLNATFSAHGPGAAGDDEAPPVSTTSTSFVHLHNAAWTTFSEDNPGFAMGCGAYARHYWSSDQDLILPANGVVSCVVGVYATAGLGTATVRFQVSLYNYVDVPIPVGAYGWQLVEAELECGTGPEDDRHCQVFIKVAATFELDVRAVACWFRNDPP